LNQRLLGKVGVRLLSAMFADRTGLAAFKEVKQAFEDVSSLKQDFDWVIKKDTVTER
jgi:hypothetical protein